MKIKVTEKSYEDVMALPQAEHRKPLKPSIFFRTLLILISAADLSWPPIFTAAASAWSGWADEPCLILMNHPSFIDLKIASTVLYPCPFNIVCTSDGFVGKECGGEDPPCGRRTLQVDKGRPNFRLTNVNFFAYAVVLSNQAAEKRAD